MPRPGGHQDQRRDDRLDVEHRDEKSVPQAAEQGSAEGDQEDERVRVAGVNAPGDDRADDGDDRADREVDALGADDSGHAERHQRRRHGAVQNVDQVAEQPALDDANLEEAGRNDSVDDQDQRQRDNRPHGAMPGDRAQPGRGRRRRRDLSRVLHGLAPAIVSMMVWRSMSRSSISPTLRRSRSTAIRSLTATSSSSSDEATSSASP